MLILTRRCEETLCIGPDIRITVLGIRGKQVRLGIRAPKAVVVDREEVHARKEREASQAAGTTSQHVLTTSPPTSSQSRAFDSTLLAPVENSVAGFSTELDKQVRLGIRAPKDVIVDREEVHVRKQLAPAGGISPDTALARPAGGISSNTAPAPPATGAL